MFRKKIIGFISAIDKKLAEFNRTQAKSKSQKAEIEKYQHIYEMRDHIKKKRKAQIWEKF
jgi:hypothetical protein